MKKYAINRLNIEIGRWCNMTCQHCFKGKREKLAFNPKYIDKFLDNIYLVNHLYFCGGEASLYIDEMQQILEIFKEKCTFKFYKSKLEYFKEKCKIC